MYTRDISNELWWLKNHKEAYEKLHNTQCKTCESYHANAKKILLENENFEKDMNELERVCYPLQYLCNEYQYPTWWSIDKNKDEITKCRYGIQKES